MVKSCNKEVVSRKIQECSNCQRWIRADNLKTHKNICWKTPKNTLNIWILGKLF